jgi:hypothetical protein
MLDVGGVPWHRPVTLVQRYRVSFEGVSWINVSDPGCYVEPVQAIC